jgi:hypothetical protein
MSNAHSPPGPVSGELPPSLALAFAPMQKRAFGVAIGFTLALIVAIATAVTIFLPQEQQLGVRGRMVLRVLPKLRRCDAILHYAHTGRAAGDP